MPKPKKYAVVLTDEQHEHLQVMLSKGKIRPEQCDGQKNHKARIVGKEVVVKTPKARAYSD